MDIPAHIRLLASIRTGSVYYFQEESLSSIEPHYFVVLNKNPRTEEFLVLVCASSKIEKRKRAMEKFHFPAETLVFISSSEYKLFTKKTTPSNSK